LVYAPPVAIEACRMVIRIYIDRINIDLGMDEAVIFKHAAEIFEPAYDPSDMSSTELSEKP
jgi:hypothetical protein